MCFCREEAYGVVIDARSRYCVGQCLEWSDDSRGVHHWIEVEDQDERGNAW